MAIKPNFINRSNDGQDKEIVLFQKNVATDMAEQTVAWKVIRSGVQSTCYVFALENVVMRRSGSKAVSAGKPRDTVCASQTNLEKHHGHPAELREPIGRRQQFRNRHLPEDVATDFDELSIAWQVIQNCGPGDNHPFTCPMTMYVLLPPARAAQRSSSANAIVKRTPCRRGRRDAPYQDKFSAVSCSQRYRHKDLSRCALPERRGYCPNFDCLENQTCNRVCRRDGKVRGPCAPRIVFAATAADFFCNGRKSYTHNSGVVKKL